MFKALQIVKHYEGCYLTAYICPAGVWTIGYGTTRYPDGRIVSEGDTCSNAGAEVWMRHELLKCQDEVKTILPALNENQLDSLTSFTYNVGIGNFNSSTLLKKAKVNPSDPTIRDEFLRWTYAKKKKLDGLVKRRETEATLYFTGEVLF